MIKNPKNAGRKPVPDELKAKTRSIKLSDADWLKYKTLGGEKKLREHLKNNTF